MSVAIIACCAIGVLTLLRRREDRELQMYSTTSWGISFVLMSIACTVYASFLVSNDWTYFFVGMAFLLGSSLVRNAGLRRRMNDLTRESE